MLKKFVILLLIGCAENAVAQKGHPAVLKAENYRHYVDYFNNMENENIAQAIPNAQAWDWMKANIPLFECPQQNFEEMWYFRWWTLRKHIKQTPVGYAITEFLVLSDRIKEMILERRPSSEIRKGAMAEGMTNLRQAAVEKVLKGETTLREINRVTFVEGSL